ncbi:hypothetical protein [Halalkalicoccus jeotgali]|uniref:Uncharacterized protein n=1 Tax=Halalkalicoccus jeotgali (strain DSM 18796 / CECT 7217 / JCM 14584 / KCTC 4019 / B3) TaxID=795797 RepID=D8J6A7_HALJB|nr:hypothetical protein [Halalkalicoccus jeotgali]ADJ15825.1 hypothetical protein HacjB3_12210 [Halalkalicoccus jeotgali B3]ELY38272.1 hypothetical protein C497_07394 [Halalkalicoccus jeotgali B3]
MTRNDLIDPLYLKAICSAILSVSFAVMAAPIWATDPMGAIMFFLLFAFVLYSCVCLVRAGS